MYKMQPVRVPHTLRWCLRREESPLIAPPATEAPDGAPVAYGAGLRSSEVVALKSATSTSTHDACASSKGKVAGSLRHSPPCGYERPSRLWRVARSQG